MGTRDLKLLKKSAASGNPTSFQSCLWFICCSSLRLDSSKNELLDHQRNNLFCLDNFTIKLYIMLIIFYILICLIQGNSHLRPWISQNVLYQLCKRTGSDLSFFHNSSFCFVFLSEDFWCSLSLTFLSSESLDFGFRSS